MKSPSFLVLFFKGVYYIYGIPLASYYNVMIDYSTIDKQCIKLVRFFNNNGLTTEFSCEGHPGKCSTTFYILFNDKVSDKMIHKFICKFPFTLGKFVKWLRVIEKTRGLKSNWMYLLTNTIKANHEWAKQDLKKFLSIQGAL